MSTKPIQEEVRIDGVSLACFLSAAASLPSIVPGKQLHCCSVKLGLSSHVSVSNSLINMYSKHKCLEDAKSVFQSIREPGVLSWNALISGLASNGSYYEALKVILVLSCIELKHSLPGYLTHTKRSNTRIGLGNHVEDSEPLTVDTVQLVLIGPLLILHSVMLTGSYRGATLQQ